MELPILSRETSTRSPFSITPGTPPKSKPTPSPSPRPPPHLARVRILSRTDWLGIGRWIRLVEMHQTLLAMIIHSPTMRQLRLQEESLAMPALSHLQAANTSTAPIPTAPTWEQTVKASRLLHGLSSIAKQDIAPL